jgi:hypothetical protein
VEGRKTCKVRGEKTVNNPGVTFLKNSLATTTGCGLLADAPYEWGIQAWREACGDLRVGRG